MPQIKHSAYTLGHGIIGHARGVASDTLHPPQPFTVRTLSAEQRRILALNHSMQPHSAMVATNILPPILLNTTSSKLTESDKKL